MKIALIGAGNVATHLGMALKKAGHKIVYVYSRSMRSATNLGNKLNASSGTSVELISGAADLYIVSISDHAIKDFLKKFPHKKKTIVHTSGSVSIKVFGKNYSDCGVLYPLQTFSKNQKVIFKEIPVIIEANNKKTEKLIWKVALSLTQAIEIMNSDERKAVHLAAVIANNFTNHLLLQSQKVLKKKNLSLELLRPLIFLTIKKALDFSPLASQTGPAKRGDTEVINEHLKMLTREPRLREIYKLLSKSIEETSGARL